MLKHVLETKDNRHDRRERFIVPLKMLYQYCIRSGIGDIEQITEKEIEGFRRSMDGKVGTKTDTYMQIVDNICMYLFLDAKHTNWKANAWYLERFDFEDGRMNPAREAFYLWSDRKYKEQRPVEELYEIPDWSKSEVFIADNQSTVL